MSGIHIWNSNLSTPKPWGHLGNLHFHLVVDCPLHEASLWATSACNDKGALQNRLANVVG